MNKKNNKKIVIVSIIAILVSVVLFLLTIGVIGMGLVLGEFIESPSEESSRPEYSTEKVECPSCGKEVYHLIRRELYEGNGDWKEWCSDCWKEFDDISIYDY
ncbi:MAG: hypothetical protein IJ397_07135 [Lachnospiraceae bacterium]|nr:hypothetical protein [Lachnospiraceae bacterium]